uniref:Uncharacterized protein n=1 Tax=Spongospora subterranea TaxID=70186 RepID=A0A0H5QG44_9EUKA|eukprot:CRZ01023.1 hypothetical protein [Spongospora subterranea]
MKCEKRHNTNRMNNNIGKVPTFERPHDKVILTGPNNLLDSMKTRTLFNQVKIKGKHQKNSVLRLFGNLEPLSMESPWHINPLVSMSTEVIPLSLNQIGRKTFPPV